MSTEAHNRTRTSPGTKRFVNRRQHFYGCYDRLIMPQYAPFSGISRRRPPRLPYPNGTHGIAMPYV